MSKNNKLYQNLIFGFDPAMMRTYKKMTSSSRKSTRMNSCEKTYVPTKDQKSEREAKKMESYAKYIKNKERSGYPAKTMEKRFKWQINGNTHMPVDPEIMIDSGIPRIQVPNELEGGFKKFFNENKKENIKHTRKMRFPIYQDFKITSRVLQPENNVIIFI